jgi:hypothetical protein
MDDVRPLSRDAPLPVYGSRETIGELRERFSYVFKETQRGGGKPRLLPITVAGDPITIGGLRFSPLPVKHGALDILGWRVDEAAGNSAPGGSAGRNKTGTGAVYLTDTSAIPDSSWPLIGCPAVLIIGALRTRPHATHFTFREALDVATRLGARRVVLTHIAMTTTTGRSKRTAGIIRRSVILPARAWDRALTARNWPFNRAAAYTFLVIISLLRQRAQIFRVIGVPPISVFTLIRLGFQVRRVLFFAWLTLLPVTVCFPHISQVRDISILPYRSRPMAPKYSLKPHRGKGQASIMLPKFQKK